MKKEIKEKIIEILKIEELDDGGWKDELFEGLADRILELFEQEKQKAIEDYAKEVIPIKNEKWRKWLEEEKQKWAEEINELPRIEITHKDGSKSRAILEHSLKI